MNVTSMGTIFPSEKERLAERRRIREQIAERKIVSNRLRELSTEIKKFESRLDQAADDHSTAVAPVQAALESIRERQIAAIADRRDPDTATESRRKELVTELQSQNVSLEKRCEEIRLEMKLVETEHYDLERSCVGRGLSTVQVLQNQLVRSGNPELLLDQFSIDQGIQFANLRLNSAVGKLRELEGKRAQYEATKDQQEVDHFDRHIRRWQHEQTVAVRLSAEAQSAAQENLQQLKNE